MAKAELIQQADDRPYLTLTLTRAEAQALRNVCGAMTGYSEDALGKMWSVLKALNDVGMTQTKWGRIIVEQAK